MKKDNPYELYAAKVNALFGGDKDVTVKYDNRRKTVIIDVSDESKATGIACLVVNSRPINGPQNDAVQVRVKRNGKVIDGEDLTGRVDETLAAVKSAFRGNPLFKSAKVFEYKKERCVLCFFKRKVVQFPHVCVALSPFAEAAGFCVSTLAEHLAGYLLRNANVAYVTEK